MITWHIHIKGLVQGVGFRPHVYRLAKQMNVTGWVNNSTNGVHIVATGEEDTLNKFYHHLVKHPPAQAKVIYHHAAVINLQQFDDFHIQHSESKKQPDLLITPDFGLCDNCRKELFNINNRRYHYPFITCTECGPRYSIIKALPYDREFTSMSIYDQCWKCKTEYHDPEDRRYYSQTNSCTTCGIDVTFTSADGVCLSTNYDGALVMLNEALRKGSIIAVKGVGGYLLMCDATNNFTISRLRSRKHRPRKPFAILYKDVKAATADVHVTAKEKEALESVAAPIVLCRLLSKHTSGLCVEQAAPGLKKIGVMLPYTPLLALIADRFDKPLVATSANLSGSPIIYEDDAALEQLAGIADYFLTYKRDIMVPQDDSVVQYSHKNQQQIILRRSRGLAPNYFSPSFNNDITALAMGGEIKSSFAMLDNNHCYVSQYLGDQGSYDSQQAYQHTLDHLSELLRFEPELILVDKHPLYFVSEKGREMASKNHMPILEVQHHKAHFSAVLAENDLVDANEKILGVIWDGTGYGDDKTVWGGEFFTYHDQKISRVAHLQYFPVITRDKMAREPRLSALSLAHDIYFAKEILKQKFTPREWDYFNHLLETSRSIRTSSMGRLLDGIASLLGIIDKSSYEGEAAMQLEALASTCVELPTSFYSIPVIDHQVVWSNMLHELIEDLLKGVAVDVIAYKVHLTLAHLVCKMADEVNANKVAFSGGVFQNGLLVDLVIDHLQDSELYFHRQLSPNDECIGFGQLAYMHIQQRQSKPAQATIELLS